MTRLFEEVDSNERVRFEVKNTMSAFYYIFAEKFNLTLNLPENFIIFL